VAQWALVALVLLASLTLWVFMALVDREQGDERAYAVMFAALQLRTDKEVPVAFDHLGIRRPTRVRTVVQAREYLLRYAARRAGRTGLYAPEVWYHLGLVYREEGRLQDAATAFEASSRIQPTREALQELLETYQALGRTMEAEAVRERLRRTRTHLTFPR